MRGDLPAQSGQENSVTAAASGASRFPAWTQEPGRVAIVHDWMTGMRGGEAILDVICELFPKADLFTLLQTDFRMSPRAKRLRAGCAPPMLGWRG